MFIVWECIILLTLFINKTKPKKLPQFYYYDNFLKDKNA